MALIFESRYDTILRTALRSAPRPDLAYDIVQQAFVVFVRGVAEQRWSVDQDTLPILQGIVKKVAMHVWKHEQKHASENLQRLCEYFGDLARNTEYREDQPDDDRLEALRSCMNRLTSRTRLLLEEYYFDGSSLEELGSRKNVHPNTLAQTFCRLRDKLRDCILRTLRSENEQ